MPHCPAWEELRRLGKFLKDKQLGALSPVRVLQPKRKLEAEGAEPAGVFAVIFPASVSSEYSTAGDIRLTFTSMDAGTNASIVRVVRALCCR